MIGLRISAIFKTSCLRIWYQKFCVNAIWFGLPAQISKYQIIEWLTCILKSSIHHSVKIFMMENQNFKLLFYQNFLEFLNVGFINNSRCWRSRHRNLGGIYDGWNILKYLNNYFHKLSNFFGASHFSPLLSSWGNYAALSWQSDKNQKH